MARRTKEILQHKGFQLILGFSMLLPSVSVLTQNTFAQETLSALCQHNADTQPLQKIKKNEAQPGGWADTSGTFDRTSYAVGMCESSANKNIRVVSLDELPLKRTMGMANGKFYDFLFERTQGNSVVVSVIESAVVATEDGYSIEVTQELSLGTFRPEVGNDILVIDYSGSPFASRNSFSIALKIQP